MSLLPVAATAAGGVGMAFGAAAAQQAVRQAPEAPVADARASFQVQAQLAQRTRQRLTEEADGMVGQALPHPRHLQHDAGHLLREALDQALHPSVADAAATGAVQTKRAHRWRKRG
eukprot:CAMPEP_0203912392 /NCGR_PEP_ID=MMETSP0359-20131031/53475_1 /ASSEMBLY_ACC=CAM_ASM_000338 /TAXON_ID=268821 /ORGANISM="Scrippsiella Hangoei, Strain SHTV-5" /LENGTH=115 /DNA_ID=CAMNT_0050838321 /DNA_START=322 /DNA_END=664 /DNA_ORIENTATION=-